MLKGEVDLSDNQKQSMLASSRPTSIKENMTTL